MSAVLHWVDEGGATVALEIDVTPTEGYESSAETTEHPVETGSAIADHVKPGNDTLTLEGVISNTPVRVPTTHTRGLTRQAGNLDLTVGRETVRVQVQQWSGTLERVRDCDGVLAGLVASGTALRLTTGLRTVENLVLIRYRVDRTAEVGNALAVSLDLKRIRVVATSRVSVPAVPRARVPQSRGAVPAAPAGSTLDNVTDDLAGRAAP